MSNEELARMIYKGDKDALLQLYGRTTGLICKYAKSYYNRHCERCRACGVELDDLISEGYFAMLDAVTEFCKSRSEYKFNTFLRYPLLTRFNALTGYRTRQGTKEPLNNCTSLDMPVSDDYEDITVADTIEDEAANFEDDTLLKLTYGGVFRAVREVLHSSPRYYEVLYMKYARGMSQRQIAEELNCGDSYVHQVLYNAMKILRRPGNKIITSYREEILGAAYHLGGLSRFKHTGESSVEWAVRKICDNGVENENM